MKSTRLPALALLVVVLALIAASCGGATATTAPAGKTGATQPTVPAPALATAVAPAATKAGAAATTAAPAATTAGGATAPAAGTAAMTGKAVSVASLWGGSEEEAFKKVLSAFTAKTGIQTQYESIRQNTETVLRSRITAGNPPEVAILPRPGQVAGYAQEGAIKPLTDVIPASELNAAYGKSWLDLGTVNGKLYGVVVKANDKSTVWYKPDSYKQLGLDVPKKWDDLIAVSDKYVAAGKTPWVVAAKASWTLTDWFENIYARQAGPDKYQGLHVTGKVPFTDPSVAEAVNTMNKIVANPKYVVGGVEGALGTDFVDGIGQVFGKSPKGEMFMEGGFVGGIATDQVNKDLKPGQDIDFFAFPEINASYANTVVGGGDLAVMFKDTPEARELIKFLASKEAGEVWAGTGAIVSPNKQVDLKAYQSELARKEAQLLVNAGTFLFDGSDQLPGNLSNDWGSALQEMISKPNDVQKILADFENKAKRDFKR